jgi:hypothetical protein
MKSVNLALIGALVVSGSAYGGTGGVNPVVSDSTNNTAMGSSALLFTGTANTASGYQALNANTTGSDNTASGDRALANNTTGAFNTASGYWALAGNTIGSANSAYGQDALHSNNYGLYNTAVGFGTLYVNYSGNYNTATGSSALYNNEIGNNNTATGYEALYGQLEATGSNNTATGYAALYSNNGNNNTASGMNALFANKGGHGNTASGVGALYHNTSGHYNIAEGWHAGFNLTTGSYNIDIGNPGVAGESGVIRIGTEVPTALQTKTYIAGIYDNTAVVGIGVVIDSNGQLGTVSSSERFKTDIAPMGSNTSKLQQLRPVTFHYKADPQGTQRYGLIAEEVATVYPELVVRDKNGRIDGVRYDELAPMLLNEMQKQEQKIDTQAKTNADQAVEIRDLKQQVAELNNLKEEMRAALQQLKSKDELVVQR